MHYPACVCAAAEMPGGGVGCRAPRWKGRSEKPGTTCACVGKFPRVCVGHSVRFVGRSSNLSFSTSSSLSLLTSRNPWGETARVGRVPGVARGLIQHFSPSRKQESVSFHLGSAEHV